MPWQEVSTVSLRQEFITMVQQKTVSVSELCRRYGVSRKTGYKWFTRYRRKGPAGLPDRSRPSCALAGWRCARSTRVGASISGGASCGSRGPSSGTPWGCSRPRRMGSWTSGSVSIASPNVICERSREPVTHVSGTPVTLDSGPYTLTKGRQGGVEASRGWVSRESRGSCKPARFLPPRAFPYKGGDSLRNHPRPSKHPHDFRKNLDLYPHETR